MKRETLYRTPARTYSLTAEESALGWTIAVDGAAHSVSVRTGERGRLALEIDGRRVLAHVASDGARLWVHVEGETWSLERVADARSGRAGEGAAARASADGAPTAGPIVAAMPGRVLDVLVAEGDEVRKGQALLLLEAMKMELRIAAPVDGVVRRVHVAAGQVIERGAALVQIDSA